MSRDEYIIYLAGKVNSGEIDFDEIRKKLQKHGLNEEDIRSMTRQIDDEAQLQVLSRAKRQQVSGYVLVGTLLTVAGLITTYTFMGSGPVVYFIGYGPFTTGLALIYAGRRAQLRTSRIANKRGSRSLRNRMNI